APRPSPTHHTASHAGPAGPTDGGDLAADADADGDPDATDAALTARVRGRLRPHINVICDLDTLHDPHSRLRLLDGTPLDPATSRRLLCDAAVHRVITRGASIVLDHGRATRTVPNALFQALVLRDRGCRFPG